MPDGASGKYPRSRSATQSKISPLVVIISARCRRIAKEQWLIKFEGRGTGHLPSAGAQSKIKLVRDILRTIAKEVSRSPERRRDFLSQARWPGTMLSCMVTFA